MNRKRWSRSEKLLFLMPALILAGAGLCHVDFSPREFRSDILQQELSNANPFRAHYSIRDWQSCSTNLKAIQNLMAQYCQDNDGRYPPVKSGGVYYGWADSLGKRRLVTGWHCPRLHPTGGMMPMMPEVTGYNEYYLNANLAGLWQSDVKDPAHTILVGDGGGNGECTTGQYAKAALPQKWLRDQTSPMFRHQESSVFARKGAYYLLADGRVEFITPREFENHTYGFNLR